MKQLYFSRLKFLLALLLLVAGLIPAKSQLALISEKFNGFPATLWAGPFKGWTSVTITGDTALDRWTFNNPISYSLPTPLSQPVAILDSYNKGILGGGVNNGAPEEVALVSPTISTVGVTNMSFKMTHLLAVFQFATAYVEVSTNGTSWTTVWSSAALMTVPQEVNVNLNTYINEPTFSVRMRWAQPNFANGNGYWVIDNVMLYTTVSQDVGVAEITQPVDFSCPNASQAVSVKITNYGTTDATNIPVTLSYSGAASGTLNTTIASLTAGASINVFTSNTINTTSGGTINFTAFTTLGGDQAGTNDTLLASVTTAPSATVPVNTPIQQCGVGPSTLVANALSTETTFWYEDNSTNSILGVGSPFTTSYSVSGSRKFYAENSRLLANNITTYFTGPYRYNALGTNGCAVFINLQCNSDLFLDSFACSFAYNGQYIVDVYHVSGSYAGFENNKSVWTLLGTDTVTATALGLPVYVNPKKIFLAGAGTTTGFAFVSRQLPGGITGLSASQAFKLGSGSFSNADATLSGSTISNDAFNGSAGGYLWDGIFFYRKACKSPRVGIDVIVKPRPANVEFVKGSKYKGIMKSGASNDPDAVKINDTVTYSIQAPNGYSNSDYNVKWTITNFELKTLVGGNPVFAPGDSATTPPSGSASAGVWFRPTGNLNEIYMMSVTVKDLLNGCDTVVKRHIYIADIPLADFIQSDGCFGTPINFNNTSTLGIGSLTYEWYFGAGGAFSDLGAPSFNYPAPGAYTVKLIVTTDVGFKDSITKTINIYAIPQAKMGVENACEGTPVKFTDKSVLPAGTPVYEWNFGDGGTSTSGISNHIYTQPGLYPVSLTVTVNGCSDHIQGYATQAPRAVPDFTAGIAQCDNLGIPFTNTSTPPLFGSWGSNWDFDDGTFASGENLIHTFNQFKTYNVKLLIITDLGCKDSIVKTVTLKEAPQAAFTTTGVLCTEDMLVFNNNTTVPAGFINTYEWDFGDGNTSAADNPQRPYLSPGTYNVKLKAISNNGCEDEIINVVTVSEKPSAAFESNKVCRGSETEFYNNSVVSDGNLTYTWDLSNGTSTDTNPKTVYATAGNFNVVLIASSPNGCKDTVANQVTVYEIPSATFNAFSANQGDGTINFTTPATGVSYLWFFGDGGTSTIQSPSYKYSFPGSWKVTLRVTSTDGCQDTSSTMVLVNPVSTGELDAKGMDVYPNPSSGKFAVDLSNYTGSPIHSMSVTDILGRTIISSIKFPAGQVMLNLEEQAAGVYYLNIVTSDNTYSVKLVIAK
ncbi:MAG TPA: PKD domain-containing protein [Bacteroidia bacterium]|nr:PKD domain-containing protein [Bacteroidia bacterium]